jgi:dynein heavy chain
MGCLLILDVHAKNVVEDLAKSNVTDIYDFAWTKQMRYYWEQEADNCYVR